MKDNNNIAFGPASFVAESVCSGSFVDNDANDGTAYTVDTYVIRLNAFALGYWHNCCCKEVSRDCYGDGPDGDVEWHKRNLLVTYYNKMFKHYIIDNLNIKEKGNIQISHIASDVFGVMHTYRA